MTDIRQTDDRAPDVQASEQIVIGVVGDESSPRRAAILEAIVRAGGEPEPCTQATAISRATALDALVFDVGDDPDALVPAVLPVAVALATDSRTRWMPRVVVVGERVPAARLAPFGPATLVSTSALDETLGAAVLGAVDQVRARNDILRTAQVGLETARSLDETLAAVEREGTALSHDARVLFGVILGFASNLRDGFAGPITEDQQRHLVNIVDASNDAAALLDHYVEGLRKSIPRSSEPPRSIVPRVAARRHNDLGELVRGTIGLFHGVASARNITLHVDAPRAVHSWCDAMQVKQALVNLVSNALKFTPPGGRIEVIARLGTPASARGGTSSRREVEIVVTDTGPGIPLQDRERIFERGVRLDRDSGTPGTGVGLAIVRDVMDLHGGTVRVEEAPGGGTSIALVFPVDLRSRSGEHKRVVPPTRGSVTPPSSRHTEVGEDSE